jgi:4-amino-4-deoxy-L-arabinose transferase-like glycosyltransferase
MADRIPLWCHERILFSFVRRRIMSMQLKSIDARQLAVCYRIVEALRDPLRRNRAALLAAICYAAIWVLYAIVAKSSQGINADLGEMAVWSRNLAWGYPKHPPLPALILAGWFAVFPSADWAFYLLSGLNLGAGLYLSFVLAGLWLDGDKRAVAPFLLAVIPFYNFIGLKWDQNSILIPLWALTTWAFVRSFERRHAGYAALAGAAAAAAMLTKYWSVFLLFAMVIAALGDHRRGAYFRSVAPWVTVLVGAVLIAPHLLWLVQHGAPPVRWVSIRASASVADWMRSLSEYSFGTMGYAGLALAAYVVLVRPSRAAWRDIMFPRDTSRRMAAIIFWLALLAPIPSAAVTRTNLLSLWSIESLALLPVILLSSPLVTLTREAAGRIVGLAIIVSGLALAASPIVAGAKFIVGVENDASYVPAAAAAVDREWQATTNRPLEILAGPFGLAASIAFTLKDRPSIFSDFSHYLSPWVDARDLQDKGLAVICPSADADCLRHMAALAKSRPQTRRTAVDLTPRWLGFAGTPARFVIAIMPPR